MRASVSQGTTTSRLGGSLEVSLSAREGEVLKQIALGLGKSYSEVAGVVSMTALTKASV